MSDYDVIVIGAGAAGMLAAGRAANLGARVLLLEKMRQEGRKLMITGKGRCNITNDAPLAQFVKNIYPDGRFLRSAFSGFFSKDIIDLLQKHGVECILERGGRYFPASGKSADVVNALKKWVREQGVEIRKDCRVNRLLIEQNTIRGIRTGEKELHAKNVILATGGKSYPATGSTGDGYALARQAGHHIIEAFPALVPLETVETIPERLNGLNLKNVNAMLWIDGKKVAEEFGELLFMEFGLSGPIVLSLSRMAVEALRKELKVEISIDLKPALDEQKLDKRLLRDLDDNGKKRIHNVFKSWLPSALIPVFMERLKLDPLKVCHQINAGERKQIRHLMKNFSFRINGHRPFEEAIITAGGVSVKEISSKTMESKKVKGLYFAGEVMDVDAETGGYNLQIAFSTGWLAGSSAAASI